VKNSKKSDKNFKKVIF